MKLEAKNVGFYYKHNSWVLRNIDFSIESGERVGILAPSGYGKSTLSRVLSGYEKAQEGEVLLDGKPLPMKTFCPVQMVYQHPEMALNPRWKMKRSLEEHYIPSEEERKRFGIIDNWLDRWPLELSGGELQRFCLLRILAPELKFLVADEISTMLDPITQAQIWSALLEIAEEKNLGLIVISHNKFLIDKVCTRTVDLEKLNKR